MSKPVSEGSQPFFFVQTEDGSPSLRIGAPETSDEARAESMHSLKGAFSETVYIYGTAIDTCLSRAPEGFRPRILSLGLGMGYVEILSAALILKDKRSITTASGESFEIVPELRDWFRAWALGDGDRRVPSQFTQAYDEILRRTAEQTGIAATEIKDYLALLLRESRWQLREALKADTPLHERFSCVCFDAFSSKSTPELWDEAFLLKFLADACERQCVFSTYACTGALKRSLRASGFDLRIREGFSSKRDSTFAVRDL